MKWVVAPLRRFGDFMGRSRRTEFWVFVVVVLVGQLVANYVDLSAGTSALVGRMRTFEALFTIAVLIPVAAVSVRRMHDVGRSGWWMLLIAVPYTTWQATANGAALNSAALLLFALAAVGLFVLLVQPGTAGDNGYGADPKADATEAVAGKDAAV
jgi:uncharacterized membrane protein YhaH (DUF805 family)